MKTAPNTNEFLSLPADSLAELKARFSSWRRSRLRGQRIPEVLWKAAADLARVEGVCRTSTALKLNYYDLQRRMSGKPATIGRPRGTPAFVELPALASTPLPAPGTVEVIRPDGWRLTLRLPAAPVRELLPLVSALLRS
jgi:hypothetical protein